MSEYPAYEPTAPDAPKKPRKKPVRKARKAAAPKPAVKKRRKRRVLKAPKAGESPKEEVFLSDAVYKTIRTLVDLTASERSLVFSIVKGLTK